VFPTFPKEAIAGQEARNSASPRLRLASLLFLLLALPAAAQPVEPDASYTRTFVNDIPNQPLVTVAVSNAVNVYNFTIEETLPAVATALDVSSGGVYLPNLNVIRWGPFLDTITTNVTYRLTGLPANYPVDGGAWMDGQWFFSPPMTVIPVLPTNALGIPSIPPPVAGPTFNPPSGSPVPTSPNGVSITESTAGAVVYYTVNGGPPSQGSLQYTSVPITLPQTGINQVWAVAYLPYQGGYVRSAATVAYFGPQASPADAAVSTLSENTTVFPGSPAMPEVNFSVTPGAQAQCVAVTETLPDGLGVVPGSVSQGGNYIAAKNVVQWGPFLGPFTGTTAMTLSYQVTGSPGTYPVYSTWSVDGTNGGQTEANNITIAPATVLGIPTVPPPVAGPTFNPPSGSPVPTSGGVSISETTPDTTVYYTVNGGPPDMSSTPGLGPILTLSPTGVNALWAVAYLPYQGGYLRSAATVAVYGPQASPADAAVSTLSENTTVFPGSPAMPVVNFSVTPGAQARCVAVTETLPDCLGVVPGSVSQGGNYIAANHVVQWGPFLGPFTGTTAMELSYQVMGPPGTYEVYSSWSVDGTNGAATAASSITIVTSSVYAVPTPTPQEAEPTLTPAFSSSLPAGPVIISCSDTSPNVSIYYTTDGTLPTQGPTLASPNSTLFTLPLNFSTKTSLRAVAFRAGYLPSVAVSGEYVPAVTTENVTLSPSIGGNGSLSPTFTLMATPQGVRCYAVVETIPYGLTPSDYGNGNWDPVASVIRWGPYLDGNPRVFSFDLSGATGTYPLSGQLSFDGYSTATTRSVQVNEVSDTTPPSVAITSLEDGATVTSASLLVSGTASDSGKGNNGIAYVTVNGLPASNGTASGANTANWSAIVPLFAGANNIIVLASDTLNNVAEAVDTVTYNPPALVNTSIQGGGGGGPQNLQTTLTGLTAGETVYVELSTDLKNWTVPQNLGFANPYHVTTGSEATFSIPIFPTSAGQFFQVIVDQN
jgi:hypothetical protein